MLHILPESREGMEAAGESLGIEWLAELVVCAGFFLVYMVEELVHLTLHSTPHREQLHKTLPLRKSSGPPDSICNTAADADCHNDMEMEMKKTPNSLSQDTNHSPGHGHSHLGTHGNGTLRDFFTGGHYG